MEWYHYVIIGAGAVILVMLLVSLFNGKKKTLTKESNHIEKPVEKEIEEAPQQPKKQEDIKVEPKKETPKVKTEEKIVKEQEPANESDMDRVVKYHVSQNKDEKSPNFKKWRVRKEGSNKTIKFFDTQKDAISYAEDLAKTAGSSVVIHKVDGSIRKQDYTKKA